MAKTKTPMYRIAPSGNRYVILEGRDPAIIWAFVFTRRMARRICKLLNTVSAKKGRK